MGRLRWLLMAWLVVSGAPWVGSHCQSLHADSALELLSGFDSQSVSEAAVWLQQPEDPQAITRVAQLLYQLRRVGHEGLSNRLGDSPPSTEWQPGDVIRLSGHAVGVAGMSVPLEQADVLEMPRVFRFQLEDSNQYVITQEVPSPWLRESDPSQAHAVRVVGIVVRTDQQGQPQVIAAPRIEWFPGESERVPVMGWRLLSAEGFDCGRLDVIRRNDKLPLKAEEPFFEMLAAAHRAQRSQVPPQQVRVLDLLKDSKNHIGQWVSLPVETVRITKVVLPIDGPAAQQIGQDHYWQLDTFAQVDGRVVIEPATNTDGQTAPIEFANRYPVSVVANSLPAGLRQAMEQKAGRDAVVAMVRAPLTVNGFYYRQWSYDTEFVQSRQGGRQFGPLLLASRLTVRERPLAGGQINWQWVVASVFLVGLAVIALGSWWVGRRDRQHVQRRREHEMDGEFPLST